MKRCKRGCTSFTGPAGKSGLYCNRCGWQIPLGPTPEPAPGSVEWIERRAQELAQAMDDARTSKRPRFFSKLGFDGAEVAGWLEHESDSQKVPEQPGEWAGWLARQIVFHDQEPSAPRVAAPMLLPPHPDACQVCATKHEPCEPHNAQSLYWHTARTMAGQPPPTWTDALAHVAPDMRALWVGELATYGIVVPLHDREQGSER